MAKVSIGHLVEIFDHFSDDASWDFDQPLIRLFDPVIIDSYSLFRAHKQEGHWTVLGCQTGFVPVGPDDLKFAYGTGNQRFLAEAWGQIETVSKADAEKYPVYSPKGNFRILQLIALAKEG